METCIRQACGKGQGASMASPGHQPPGTSMCFSYPELGEPYPCGFSWGFITWAWLTEPLATGGQLNLQPLSRLHWLGGGVESPNPLITKIFPVTSPILKLHRGGQPSLNSLAYKRTLNTLEIPRTLGVVCQEMEGRPNIYFMVSQEALSNDSGYCWTGVTGNTT